MIVPTHSALPCVLIVLLASSTATESPERPREPVALARAPQRGAVFAACADGTLVRLEGSEVAGECVRCAGYGTPAA